MAQNLPKESLKFTKFHIRSVQLDPGSILRLDIYESIDFPGITGSLIFKDFSNIKESIDAFANDPFDITFGRESEQEIQLKMKLFSSGGDLYDDEEAIGDAVSFGFCSPWLIDGFGKKRTRHFRGKRIDEIVRTLLTDAGASIGTIVQTNQTLDRYVTPYLSPITCIQHLMEIAMDVNGNGGYALWTDMKTGLTNFMPVGNLISEDNITGDFNLRMRPRTQEYPGNVYDFEMNQQYDIIKYGQIGMSNMRFVGFNYDRTEVMNAAQTVDEYSNNHLSTVLPLNEFFLGRQYRTTKDSFRFPNTATLIRDKAEASKHIDGRLNTMYTNLTSDAIEILTTVRGEVDKKRAGKLIWLDFPNTQRTGTNSVHTGRYLIQRIRHTIVGGEYVQQLSLIADGYKQTSRTDLINWQNASINNEIEDDFDRFDVDSSSEFKPGAKD